MIRTAYACNALVVIICVCVCVCMYREVDQRTVACRRSRVRNPNLSHLKSFSMGELEPYRTQTYSVIHGRAEKF
jgi:hypothetical protein